MTMQDEKRLPLPPFSKQTVRPDGFAELSEKGL